MKSQHSNYNDFLFLTRKDEDLDNAFKSFLGDFVFIFQEKPVKLYFVEDDNLLTQKFLDRVIPI